MFVIQCLPPCFNAVLWSNSQSFGCRSTPHSQQHLVTSYNRNNSTPSILSVIPYWVKTRLLACLALSLKYGIPPSSRVLFLHLALYSLCLLNTQHLVFIVTFWYNQRVTCFTDVHDISFALASTVIHQYLINLVLVEPFNHLQELRIFVP